jgi:tight adherence protein B
MNIFFKIKQSHLYDAVLTALPPITALLLFLANREYVMELFTTPMGQKMLATAVVLQVTGFFVMKQITRLKV